MEVITTGATQRHARRSTALARRPRRRHRRLDGISRRLHDNAVAESLVANPEKELVHRCAWPTRRKLPPRSSRHRSLLEPHPPFTRRSAASRPSSSRSSQRQELQGSTATARLASPWGRRNGSTPEPARADSVRSCGQHTRQCSASCTSSAKITPAQSERHRVRHAAEESPAGPRAQAAPPLEGERVALGKAAVAQPEDPWPEDPRLVRGPLPRAALVAGDEQSMPIHLGAIGSSCCGVTGRARMPGPQCAASARWRIIEWRPSRVTTRATHR